MLHVYRKIGYLLLLVFFSSAYAGELYKYKDNNGKWIFSDKKPAGNQTVETLQQKENRKKPRKPSVYIKNSKGRYSLVAHNPYHAPIEIEVNSSMFKGGSHREVVSAASTKTIFESNSKIPRYRYKWRLGDSTAKEDNYRYLVPVSSSMSHKISQSFKGAYSHTKRPNIYAVDIAMPVGTYISAARDGTVIWVKDDYHMGGKKRYFLDKANYVKVLHQDGTYAVYAHLLLGSALVKPGDKIVAGDRLARSGSSGFSTGPHLHFVIRKNTGSKTVSIPFQFVDNSDRVFVPTKNMRVMGGVARGPDE